MREVTALAEVLARRQYPGRGCLAASSTSGEVLLGYFLTGRSAESRSRSVLTRRDGDVEIVGSRPGQDALRHYVAAARRGGWLVVGNGSQVVPIAEDLEQSGDVDQAWAPHTYEPDPPIFTPRIWVAWHPDRALVFGQARRSHRADRGPDRVACFVEGIPSGGGVLLTTYKGTVDDVVTAREPIDIEVAFQTPAEFSEAIWECLEPELRVACFVVDPAGEREPLTTHAASAAFEVGSQ